MTGEGPATGRRPGASADRRRLILGILGESLPRRRTPLALLILVAMVAALAEGSGLLLLGLAVPILVPDAGAGMAVPWLPVPLTLPVVLAGYLSLAVLAAVAIYARTRSIGRLRADTIARLRHRLLEAFLAAEWSWLRDQRAAELTRIATADTTRVAHGVEFAVRSASIVLRVPILLAIAAGVSPGLTATVLGGAALALAALARIDRRARASHQLIGDSWRRLHARVADVMAGRRVVKAGSLEAATLRDLDAQSRAWQDLSREREDRDAVLRCGYQIGLAVAVAAGLWLAVDVFRLGLAEGLVAILALARIGHTGLALHGGWRAIVQALQPYGVIRDTLAVARAHREPDAAGAIAPPRRAIVLDHVSVSHGRGQGLALDEVTASIPVEGMTAIVGPSGSGKSTLIDLVIGLTAPDTGSVLLDDRPLRPADRPAWRRLVGYLPQQPFLFDHTIRGNLLAACPDADEAAMLKALRDADAGDLLESRPHGLDAEVGEHGDRLSGGERQRIALACALIRRPRLLVLDEPTSGLDRASEERVMHALARQARQRTVVIVTHRPEVAALCPVTIHLREGRLVERSP